MVAEAPSLEEEECRKETREIRQQDLKTEEMGRRLMEVFKRHAEILGRDRTSAIMKEISEEPKRIE